MMDFILKILLGAFVLLLIIALFMAILMLICMAYEECKEGPLLQDIKSFRDKHRKGSGGKGGDNETITD